MKYGNMRSSLGFSGREILGATFFGNTQEEAPVGVQRKPASYVMSKHLDAQTTA